MKNYWFEFRYGPNRDLMCKYSFSGYLVMVLVKLAHIAKNKLYVPCSGQLRINSFVFCIFFILILATRANCATNGNFRVMVIIPEYHISHFVPDPAGETEIIRILLENGYKVVDQQQTAKIRYNDEVTAAIKGDSQLATKIGLSHGAEIIIVGEAFSETAGRLVPGGFITCRSRIEARAIKTDTGEIIAASGKYASGLDVAEFIAGKKAIQKAGVELGQYFIDQFSSKMNNKNSNAKSSIDLIVDGLNYEKFVKFKSGLLNNFQEITEINQQSFSNNQARAEVNYSGSTQSLSEQLMSRNIIGYKIEIEEVTSNRISLLVKTTTK